MTVEKGFKVEALLLFIPLTTQHFRHIGGSTGVGTSNL